MFEPVNSVEVQKVFQSLFNGKISLVGRSENKTLILLKILKDRTNTFDQFTCEFKTNKQLLTNEWLTLSFVCFGKKYLFSANFKFIGLNSISILPTTKLFALHRRHSERLYIPDDYYAVLKITNLNNKIIRSYLKINNISITGCGVLLRNEEPNIVANDIIKGVLTFSSRLPLDIEAQVRHKLIVEEGKQKLQQIGLLFLPANSTNLHRRMKVIVSDIYRDLFSTKN